MKTKLFLTGLALVAVTLFAAAQNPDSGRGRCCSGFNRTNKCAAFVDSDKNGICDTYESRIPGNGTKNGNCNGSGLGVCKWRNAAGASQKGVCNHSGPCSKK